MNVTKTAAASASSERYRAEDARMRWLLQAAPDATAIVDEAGRIVTMNSQLEELFGYDRADLVGQLVDCLVPERFRAGHHLHREVYAADPRARPMGVGRHLFAVRQDGSEFAAEISLSSLLTPEGLLVSVAVRDVTERRQVEDRFRRFIESAPDAVVVAEADGTIVLVNAQTEQLFGYPRAELLGAKVEILVPEQHREIHPQRRAEYAAAPRVRSMGIGLELCGRRKDGSQFPIEISLSPMETDAGTLVSSSIRDLTERHQLDTERAALAAIVESSVDAIIGTTLDGRITSWNAAAETLFGYTRDEAVGRAVEMLLPEDSEHEVEERLAELRANRPVKVHDAVRRCRDGRLIDVSISMSAIRDHAGRLIGASKVVRDITERKRFEADLAAARDAAETASEAFEAFSYSVAHDLRAPLRAIDGFGQILADECSDQLDDAGRGYLSRVRASAQRMAVLIDSLLELAKITHHELGTELVDLSALAVSVSESLVAHDPDRDVDLIVESGLFAHGDAVLLANVLENLLSNAWKFTSHRERARIEFGRDQEGYFVQDNGAGFEMARAGKLFGVFQRLHSPEEFAGTGVGLATVQRIVVRHGGRIWAESEPGQGAVFRFTLAQAKP